MEGYLENKAFMSDLMNILNDFVNIVTQIWNKKALLLLTLLKRFEAYTIKKMWFPPYVAFTSGDIWREVAWHLNSGVQSEILSVKKYIYSELVSEKICIVYILL